MVPPERRQARGPRGLWEGVTGPACKATIAQAGLGKCELAHSNAEKSPFADGFPDNANQRATPTPPMMLANMRANGVRPRELDRPAVELNRTPQFG